MVRGPVILGRAYSAVSDYVTTLPLTPGDTIHFAIEEGLVGRVGYGLRGS